LATAGAPAYAQLTSADGRHLFRITARAAMEPGHWRRPTGERHAAQTSQPDRDHETQRWKYSRPIRSPHHRRPFESALVTRTDMPVWGDVFKRAIDGGDPEAVKARIDARCVPRYSGAPSDSQ
jgi:hypothetical protein